MRRDRQTDRDRERSERQRDRQTGQTGRDRQTEKQREREKEDGWMDTQRDTITFHYIFAANFTRNMT